jgi:hypothetical protein
VNSQQLNKSNYSAASTYPKNNQGMNKTGKYQKLLSKQQLKNWLILMIGITMVSSLSVNVFFFKNNKELQICHDREVLRSDSLLSAKLLLDKQLDESKALIRQYQSEKERVKK